MRNIGNLLARACKSTPPRPRSGGRGGGPNGCPGQQRESPTQRRRTREAMEAREAGRIGNRKRKVKSVAKRRTPEGTAAARNRKEAEMGPPSEGLDRSRWGAPRKRKRIHAGAP